MMRLDNVAIKSPFTDASPHSFSALTKVRIEAVPWGAAFHVCDEEDRRVIDFHLTRPQLERLLNDMR